jgi:hypothetical protein
MILLALIIAVILFIVVISVIWNYRKGVKQRKTPHLGRPLSPRSEDCVEREMFAFIRVYGYKNMVIGFDDDLIDRFAVDDEDLTDGLVDIAKKSGKDHKRIFEIHKEFGVITTVGDCIRFIHSLPDMHQSR